MAPVPHHIAQLLFKHLSGTLSEAEQAELQNWFAASEDHHRFAEELDDDLMLGKLVAQEQADDALDIENVLLQRAKSQLSFSEPVVRPIAPRVRLLRRWWAAASVIFILVAGIAWYFLSSNKQLDETRLAQNGNDDALPGGNHARLTLSGGETIVLDTVDNGQLANLGNLSIIKVDSGTLAYKGGNTGAQYNTLSIPAGGQFQLVLPDGTRVWLNAESNIRFPTAFTGKDRIVELTGEGYFEVAHNALKPFIVRTAGSDVQVLGTHFNVEAYPDESVQKTTLLEGKVKVTGHGKQIILKPRQQAVLTGADLQLRDADNAEDAIAWKNGIFIFNHEPLESIMRKVARWYNIKVEFQDADLAEKVFSGSVSRFDKASDVLRMLSAAGKIYFKIKNNQVIISKKEL